ncbi:MAG: urea ABC transporter ATP-binding subunit UrtE [Chloroflexales bacterium]|nr:urea ABC transporter ATP-binding subunit UrtE [Chloroflexales bacterium]
MLSVEHLNVSYGESPVLNDVDLRVEPGQVVCLLGRNGVGKTTLLKSIMGLLRPAVGRVVFNSRDVTHLPTYLRARGGIGYVPQGRGIFPYLTVEENLIMGFETLRIRRNSALEEVYAIFPVLKKMARRTAGVLSGGQQQQLAIGRAMLGNPQLLLLDEPTEGIQPSIVGEIEDVIGQLHERSNIAILLVEQFLDFALGVASYYYMMEKGCIVAEGLTQEMNQATVQQYLAI